jgi:UDP-N-acetylmuramoyl-tripeptide--D-alanyl-D-alanine ligase
MMRAFTLAELAERCGASAPAETLVFTSVTSDSRKLQKGDLFVALRGENFDGHVFVEHVARQGACAAVVEKKQNVNLPQLVVDNTVYALGHLGALNRGEFQGPVIAITGSSGKTTVKEMVASVLALAAGDKNKVLATRGNLNNHIGVPQMLMEINPQHHYAVIEMGASAVGEIAYLAKLAQPQVSVVNNVGSAHVAGFGSVDNIAKGKGEIYHYLGSRGVAVINLDDSYSAQWLQQTIAFKQITFSAVKNADVTAKNISCSRTGCFTFDLLYKKEKISVQLPLIGEHNIANALAAAACCLALGVDLLTIKRGLETVVNVAGRMEIKPGINDSCIIDDTYNANPASMRAAIDALSGMEPGEGGKRVLILGDMAELGDSAENFHREIGEYIQQKNIDDVLTVGQFSAWTSGASIAGDSASHETGRRARHFSSKADIVAACKKVLQKNDVVLVKGSRSSGMEDVVNGLVKGGYMKEGSSTC